MTIPDLLKNPEKAKAVLANAIDNKDKKLAEILIPIVRDPWLTYRYARDVVGGEVKGDFEDIIFLVPDYGCYYVTEILKKPLPRKEDIISKWPYCFLNYVKNVLRDRLKQGEDNLIRIWLRYGDSSDLREYMDFLKEIGKLDEFLKDHPEVRELNYEF
jgi:hypothetical protein